MKRTDRPALTRSGESSPIGKLDDRIESYAIEGAVKAELMKQAAAEQLPLAEYLRKVNRITALGKDRVNRLHTEQINRIARKLGQ